VAGPLVAFGLLLLGFAFFREQIESELPKAYIQVVVVALGGSLIAAVVRAAETDRERRATQAQEKVEEARRDFEYLMSVLGEVTDAYNRIKSARRDLIDEKITPANLTASQLALLKRKMDALSDAQLSLESMMRIMRVRKHAFLTGPLWQVTYCLRQMEGYVNEVRGDALNTQNRTKLAAFLGNPDVPGGLREGRHAPYAEKVAAGEQPSADWREASPLPGKGPSAHLRHIEEFIAKTTFNMTARP
jgi:hypothetical protein